MRIITALSIVILITVSCSQGEENKPGAANKKETNIQGIILARNTSMRIDPYIFSSKVKHLQKGDSVTITGKSNKKSWIGKSNHYWYQVKDGEGFKGWVYGKNIKLLKPGKDEETNRYLKNFFSAQVEDFKKKIKGKWWSYNQFDDFTNHGLEFYLDGTYRSYKRGGEKWAIEGNYTIDYKNNTITFLKGTTFGKFIHFEQTGTTFILTREMEKFTLRMKMITSEIDKEKSEKN